MKQLVTARWVSLIQVAAVAALTVLLVACNSGSSRQTSDGDGDGDTGEDGGAVNANPDAAPETPNQPSVGFRLTNAQASDSIFVQITCSQDWVAVFDSEGARVRIDADCGFCSCDACEPCAVCGCALLIEPVAAATSRDHNFDGTTHPIIHTEACGSCETTRPLEPGNYTARFCYFRDPGGAGQATCGEETFTYPPATPVVEHIVSDR